MSMIDLHIHTTASDGTDTPRQLVDKLRRQGIHTFAVTDHDTIRALAQTASLAGEGMRMIPGIEFSCISPGGKCHILGYGFDPAAKALEHALAMGRSFRQEKLQLRLDHLHRAFGLELTEEESAWLRSQESPGKPHLGKILVTRGLAQNMDDAIQRCINPCKGGRDRIDADIAIRAISLSGGIPVWAHPLGGEGEPRLERDAFEAQLKLLAEYGIRGLECHYSRYTPEEAAFLADRAAKWGLLVSGGSDYHGANKADIRLGQLNRDNGDIAPESISILNHL